MSKLYQHWFSYGLIFAWLAVWLIGRKIDLMEPFAGKGLNLIGHGYHRYGTALLLHKDLLHVAANALALYWVGVYLEPQISPGKLCVFALLAGVIAQLIFSMIYRNSTSFDGSPIVFTLIGLSAVWTMMKAGSTRFQLGTRYGNWILGYAVLSNLPILGNDLSLLVIHGISLICGMLLGGAGIGLHLL